jgi:hypothetical protein
MILEDTNDDGETPFRSNTERDLAAIVPKQKDDTSKEETKKFSIAEDLEE